MAPFVEMEWGEQAYELMWEIKRIFDPQTVLNPDVILTRNQNTHIENLKPIPEADDLVDPCIECGFCEPVCPSKNFTLTPRQRIVIMRELKRQQRDGKQPEYQTLLDDYQYMGVDTCAADGLCSLACPVGINTGDLSRKLRSERNAKHAGKARWVADHFAGITKASRAAFTVTDFSRELLGDKTLIAVSKAANTLTFQKTPVWHNAMPGSATQVDPLDYGVSTETDFVYFPSCASRTMGPAPADNDQRSLMQVTLDLAAKAGLKLAMLSDQEKHCCGMPLESKGHFEQADAMRDQLNQALLKATDNGRIPVLIDTSPCVFRMTQQLEITLDQSETPWELRLIRPGNSLWHRQNYHVHNWPSQDHNTLPFHRHCWENH